METLGQLFGSEWRVRMLRLFLFNTDHAFDTETIATRVQATSRTVSKELHMFRAIGLIKDRVVTKVSKPKNGRKESRKKVRGWTYDESFPYGKELSALLTNTVPLKNGRMVEKLNQVGKIKLLVVAGLFIQDSDSRVDMLIVGDQLKRKTFERVIKDIEADVGTELRYALFETDDFKYRLSVYDKLVKDIFDFPHHSVVDKLGIQA